MKIIKVTQNWNTIVVQTEDNEVYNFPVESIVDKEDLKQKVKDMIIELSKSNYDITNLKTLEGEEI